MAIDGSSIGAADPLVASKSGAGQRLQNLLIPVAAGLLALLIYLGTMAPDLSWAHFSSDSGELITAAMTGGIPHPPGYPSYLVLGRLAGSLPIGPSVAWRFNLLSAVCAAAAVFFITALANDRLADHPFGRIAAVSAGLSTGFAPIVWGQATVAEVYTLNMAVVAMFLWSVLVQRSSSLRGFFLGLAITTHLSSLLLIPLALGLSNRRQWRDLALGVGLGLLPLIILPFLARTDSPVIWGEPATASGWWWLVSARLYHANVGLPTDRSLAAHTAVVMSTLLRQFLYAGWLIIVLGLAERLFTRRETTWLMVTSLLFLLYILFYHTDDAVVYVLPLFVLVSPLLAAGFTRLRTWSLLFPLVLLLAWWQSSMPGDDFQVRERAQDLLRQAPEDALLITSGDQSIFTLWYFQHVESLRTDLILVDANLLAFDWYRGRLQQQYPSLEALDRDDLQRFQLQNGRLRSVCIVAPELTGSLNCLDGPLSGQSGLHAPIVIKE